jgi:HK97 family phage major capsid protein
MDAQAETIRQIQRMGLSVGAGGMVAPRGRQERIQMLADGRAFMDDRAAERLAAYVCLRYAGADQIPAKTRDIGLEVCKAGDLDPAVGTAGEFLLPDEFRAELVRNVEAMGVVFPLCRRVPLFTLGGTTWPTRTGGLTAYPTAAFAKIQKSAPAFSSVTMQPVKWATLTGIPNEFYQTRLLVELGQFLGTEISYALAYAFDNAILNGDGSADYGGVTGILQSATISAASITAAHTSIATITGTDVSEIIAALTKSYVTDPYWLLSLSVERTLRALKATTGMPLYLQGTNGEPNTIDGYPYKISQRMPAAAACVSASNKWGIFGDLRLAYFFGMIGEIRIDLSEHIYFESDATAVRGVAYMDAKEVDKDAVVVAKNHA